MAKFLKKQQIFGLNTLAEDFCEGGNFLKEVHTHKNRLPLRWSKPHAAIRTVMKCVCISVVSGALHIYVGYYAHTITTKKDAKTLFFTVTAINFHFLCSYESGCTGIHFDGRCHFLCKIARGGFFFGEKKMLKILSIRAGLNV